MMATLVGSKDREKLSVLRVRTTHEARALENTNRGSLDSLSQ